MISRLFMGLRCSLNWWRLRKKLLLIKVIILDVDGVLTDGGLYYAPNGEVSKRFDVKDGLGIKLLQKSGLNIIFLSGGRAGSTDSRAIDLGIQTCLTDIKDKPMAINHLCIEMKISPREMLFVGDDLNDLALKDKVSILVATADANVILRSKADLVLTNSGGHGAVRELAERIIRIRSNSRELLTEGWIDKND